MASTQWYPASDPYWTRSGTVVSIATGTTIIDTGSATLRPTANDGGALGTASISYSDLFLASGGVINFANSDVTITHSTDTLTLASSSSVATATTVRVWDAGLTLTGASAVNSAEALRGTVTTNVQSGNW